MTYSSQPATVPYAERRHFSWYIAILIGVLVIAGGALRVRDLGAASFAEDEMRKLDAIHAYDRGDLTDNAEHPLLMKALMYVSVHGARVWLEATDAAMSAETALRLPNALLGALTTIPLFLLCQALFNRKTALLAAAFWALGINAVMFNRIGKEDTALVFFMLFGFYGYLRAKQTSSREAARKRRFYAGAGVAFGLMLASKYFPHYFGLNQLYHKLYRVRIPDPGEPRGRTPWMFYQLIGISFLIANPIVLFPSTWGYLLSYTQQDLLTHTGYLMGGELYFNLPSRTPFWGTPLYFYLLYFATKVPIPVLAGLVIGLIEIGRRWREPACGFLIVMFVLWLVPFSLSGAKWLRYSLPVMPIIYMIAAVGVMAVLQRVVALPWIPRAGRLAIQAAIVAVFVLGPAWSAYRNSPHYLLYMNPIGEGQAGHYFPTDEFYDHGLRDIAGFICGYAPTGAVVAHENPRAYSYYMQRCLRTDLQSRILSSSTFDLREHAPAWVVLQPGTTYFENIDEIRYARAHGRNVFELTTNGAVAGQVFAVDQSR